MFTLRKAYTTGQLAEILAVSQQTVIRAIDTGLIRGFVMPGSRFRRVSHVDLVRFVEGAEGYGWALEAIRAAEAAEAAPVRGVPEQDCYTTGELGRLLGLAPRTVSKMMALGEIEGYRLPGSPDRRVRADQLEDFLVKNPGFRTHVAEVLAAAPAEASDAPAADSCLGRVA